MLRSCPEGGGNAPLGSWPSAIKPQKKTAALAGQWQQNRLGWLKQLVKAQSLVHKSGTIADTRYNLYLRGISQMMVVSQRLFHHLFHRLHNRTLQKTTDIYSQMEKFTNLADIFPVVWV